MRKILIIVAVIVSIFASAHLFFNYLDRLSINQTTKTCLVTGASSGIGAEISREMINRGWKVVGVARRSALLNELQQKLGADNFIPYICDVSDFNAVHVASADMKVKGLRPTLFFLNAGTGNPETKYKPLLNIHKQTFDTNYFGVVAWVDEWLNEVNQWGGGTFVAISSIASIFGTAAGYCASKAAVNACFKALRLQYLNDNIGFSIVLPGPVQTDMLKVDKPLSFTHSADDEARYIVQQVFDGKKQIEPSLFYSCLVRILNWLPDRLVKNDLK